MGQTLKRSSKPCVWEGVEYISMREASRETGIPYARLVNWLKRGKPSKPRKIPCEWNGVHYESIKQAADANWITPVGMWFRIRKNGYKSDAEMLYGKGSVE